MTILKYTRFNSTVEIIGTVAAIGSAIANPFLYLREYLADGYVGSQLR